MRQNGQVTHTNMRHRLDLGTVKSDETTPGVKHVVDQDDVAAFDIAGQFSAADDGFRPHRR